MADFEDALSPTWTNVVEGQAALADAVRRRLTFRPRGSATPSTQDDVATLVVRPRGWHLVEAHVVVDGEPMSASLFDFGLYLFHNAREPLARGSGPYFYLPKLESHLEARLWNDVFVSAQAALGVPPGTIRATVLIETIWAAFEMDEILYELREHAAGLNAGRWDYIFSVIKAFATDRDDPAGSRPGDDGRAVHARLHAAAGQDVPSPRRPRDRRHERVHPQSARARGDRRASSRVREDKEREAGDGFDGTWVAHPDLVPVAWRSSTRARRPAQPEGPAARGLRPPTQLLDVDGARRRITEAGVRANVSASRFSTSTCWLGGNGAAAINNLMEDVATAEISRSQLWQWRDEWRDAGRRQPDDRRALHRASATRSRNSSGPAARTTAEPMPPHSSTASSSSDDFADFLTIPAYAAWADPTTRYRS